MFSSSHLGLEVVEESSFLGSSEFIDFGNIGLVVSKVGGLTVSLIEGSAAGSVFVGGDSGFFDDGLTTVVVTMSVSTSKVSVTLGKVSVLYKTVGMSRSFNNGIAVNCVNNRVGENFLDYWLVEDFMDDFLSSLLVRCLQVSFMDERNMLLFNKSGMFLVNNGLMMLVDVLFNNNWLVMFMDDVLMVLVHDILLMFNENILVMLMDNILMDFFDNGLEGVGLSNINFISSQNLSSFVE